MHVTSVRRPGRGGVRLAQWLSAVGGAAMIGAGLATPARAQTLDDAVFMDRRFLCAGLMYTRDQWSKYWEGSLKRDNGNIGTLTTQSAMYMATYGLTKRLNVIATLPYLWTRASQGVLQGQSGSQDITVGLKYRAFSTPLTTAGTLQGIVSIGAMIPTSKYTPDFYPMSIGSSSKRATGRAMLSFRGNNGVFVNGSMAYTRRGNVTLDRVSYYTNGELFLTNQVQMPDVTESAVTLGYYGHGLYAPISLVQQRTLGGGDIRRQDMPFVSNRMDFTRVDAMARYAVPRVRGVQAMVGGSHVLTGRNVGQSTSITAGLLLVGKL